MVGGVHNEVFCENLNKEVKVPKDFQKWDKNIHHVM